MSHFGGRHKLGTVAARSNRRCPTLCPQSARALPIRRDREPLRRTENTPEPGRIASASTGRRSDILVQPPGSDRPRAGPAADPQFPAKRGREYRLGAAVSKGKSPSRWRDMEWPICPLFSASVAGWEMPGGARRRKRGSYQKMRQSTAENAILDRHRLLTQNRTGV